MNNALSICERALNKVKEKLGYKKLTKHMQIWCVLIFLLLASVTFVTLSHFLNNAFRLINIYNFLLWTL